VAFATTAGHEGDVRARTDSYFAWKPPFRYTANMSRRITLETPSGRRYDSTPPTRRERIGRSLSIAAAFVASAALWVILLWPLIQWLRRAVG
jgi:hypothetical protein